MGENRSILGFLKNDYLPKLILLLLAYAIVPVAEVFLFIYLGGLLGNYLVLALAATIGIPGALIAWMQAQRTFALLRARIGQGRYPGRELIGMTGLLVSGVLLVTPGFITDILGFLLLIPRLRDALGVAVARRLRARFRDVYDYFKLKSLR